MCKRIIKFKLYRLGYKYVNTVKNSKFKGIVYGVKPYTDVWGFWYVTDRCGLIPIDECYGRDTAKFKLLILMGDN